MMKNWRKWWKIMKFSEKWWNYWKTWIYTTKMTKNHQKNSLPPKIPYESNVKKMAKKVIKMTKNHDFNEKRWKIEKIDKKMKILIKICKNWWKL